MSRKRKPKHNKPEAVPQDIDALAEGTGPVTDVVDVVDAQALADAATVAFAGESTSAAEGELTDEELSDAQPSSGLTEGDSQIDSQIDPPVDPHEPRADAQLDAVELAPEEVASDLAVDESLEATPADDAEGEPGSELDLAADGEPGEPGEDGGDAAAATLPTSAATMEPAELKRLVEALIFASDKPVTLQRLRQLTRVSDVRRLEQALADLGEDYRERGISLQSVSGGYQFRTHTKYSGWVQQLIAGRPVRLSRAQLETLSIIAYRQPITRPEIDEIRGVDASGTLRVLIERSLIRILGKREEVGRPMLYGTTKEFLDFFSLTDLRELPTLREYSELTAESRRVMTDRLGPDLAPSGGAPDFSETVGASLADELATEAPELIEQDQADAPIAGAADQSLEQAAEQLAAEMTTTDEALAQSFDDDVDAVIATSAAETEDAGEQGAIAEVADSDSIEAAADTAVLAEQAAESTSSADDAADSVIDPVD